MSKSDYKAHWENIYKTKQLNEVSWYQPSPSTSLNLIKELNLPLTAKIIDIGGGDSFLVDNLLNFGYLDITILDISKTAIDRAKKRLGKKASLVKWIVEDIRNFNTNYKYDLWHDRAAFHFLTKEADIENYKQKTKQHLSENGHLIIGTFSDLGPKKCSGIQISQYSKEKLAIVFLPNFEAIKCFQTDHPTPFHTTQNFLFCRFKKLPA